MINTNNKTTPVLRQQDEGQSNNRVTADVLIHPTADDLWALVRHAGLLYLTVSTILLIGA